MSETKVPSITAMTWMCESRIAFKRSYLEVSRPRGVLVGVLVARHWVLVLIVVHLEKLHCCGLWCGCGRQHCCRVCSGCCSSSLHYRTASVDLLYLERHKLEMGCTLEICLHRCQVCVHPGEGDLFIAPSQLETGKVEAKERKFEIKNMRYATIR